MKINKYANVLSCLVATLILTACNSGSSQSNNVAPPLDATSTTYNNIAVLNNPSLNDVTNIANYKLNLTNQPFYNTVVLFASNIHGNTPDEASLYNNQYLTELLDTPEGIAVIRGLQHAGIKVQLSYLGDWQNAGWSCAMSAKGVESLSNQMVAAVNHYGADGIMIDDEYSNCSGHVNPFYALVKSIKTNPAFAGKVLTKVLYDDSQYFKKPYNVAEYLDAGYEMTYDDNVNDLTPYIGYGMSKSNLGLGVNPGNTLDGVGVVTQAVIAHGYSTMMVCAPNTVPAFIASPESAASYYTQIAQGEYGQNATVTYQAESN